MSDRRGYLVPALTVAACVGVLITGCATPAPNSSAGASTVAASAVAPAASAAATAASVPARSAPGSAAPALPECDGGVLSTLAPGQLTIATGTPAASPWFAGESPASGEGLESAVAFAVAQALGYGPDRVTWTTADRAQAAAGTVTGFDVDLDQFTAPDAGTPTADYSTGYFSVTEALVMAKSATAAPESAAELHGLALGTVTGTSGAADVQRITGTSPTGYSDQSRALAGLRSGAVTGVVLSTPAAIASAAADPGIRVVGQLPTDPSSQPEQFKILLPKGSALTGCVSAAVDRLRVEGTLDALARQWVDPVVPTLG
ncbi:MAG TPA: transporter substrate-binding domain-containing protein [Mycobacterium sp.]